MFPKRRHRGCSGRCSQLPEENVAGFVRWSSFRALFGFEQASGLAIIAALALGMATANSPIANWYDIAHHLHEDVFTETSSPLHARQRNMRPITSGGLYGRPLRGIR